MLMQHVVAAVSVRFVRSAMFYLFICLFVYRDISPGLARRAGIKPGRRAALPPPSPRPPGGGGGGVRSGRGGVPAGYGCRSSSII